jgi:dipeptidyl-peptidase-4
MNKLTWLLVSGLAVWSVNVAGNNHPVSTLTIERIFQSPSLQGASQKKLQVSPDGKRVTFLQGKKTDYERLDLWEYDINI